MINTNKRWLLSASPWMRSIKLSRLATTGLFCGALLLLNMDAKAQGGPSKDSKGSSHTMAEAPSAGAVFTAAMPAIAGSTTTTCVGTHITLTNSMSGGTWTASNGNVTLTPSGSSVDVLGVTPGTTVVTYTVGVNSISKTVTVMGPITGPSGVCTGNSMTLTDATPTGLWTSSDATKATVSAAGVVSGIANGSVTITYQRVSDNAACYVTANVTISTNSATISPALPVVCVGNTTTLTGTPAGGTWSSSNTAQATIGSTGIATGIAGGNPTITYNVSGCYATKTLIVNATAPAAIGGTAVVCAGNTTALTDATPLGTWSTSNASVATVNAGGIVTGVTGGTATIAYTKSGCAVQKTVTVNANTVGAITGSVNLCAGGGTTTLNDTTAGGTWSETSSLISLAGAGASVTVTAGSSTGTAMVTYTAPSTCYQVTSLTINPSGSVGTISGPASVCQGSSVNLTDAVPGGVWSSSNTAIGSVDAYGHVTGVAVAGGTFNIVYTRLGCTTTQAMTVNALPTVSGTLALCNSNNVATTQVTLTPTPAGGTWASSNTAVATVGASTGVVTSAANGTANISYTSTLGCTAIKVVTVNGPVAISATGGNLVACLPLSTGGLASYVYLGSGSTGTWSSSNTTIATVSTGGVVTGKAVGTANITYTLSGCASKVTVTVNSLPNLITGIAATCVGSTTALTDTSGGGLGTWSSSNTAVGTVSTAGAVYGVAPGGTIISYTLNGCTQTMNVTVGAALNPITSASATGFSVCAGYAKDTLLTTNPGGTWSASNTNVLVSGGTSSATVTGLATGTTTITYSLSGCYTTKTVTVIANSTGSISGTPFACTGLTTTLTSTTSSGIWSVRDPIATATAGSATTGIITGVSAGTTVVTYTNPANGCFKTFVFNVEPQPVAITTAGGAVTLCNGTTLALSDASAGGSWSSSNTSIAKVSSAGVASGIGVGTAVITYALPGGCQVFQPLAVLATPNSIVYKSKHFGGVCTDTTNLGHIAIAYDSVGGGTWSNPAGYVTFGTSAPYGFDSVQIIAGTTAGTTTITYTLSDGCYTTTTVTVGSVVPSFSDPNNLTPWNYCQGGTLDTLQLGGSYTSGLRAWTVLNKGSNFVSNIASISNFSATFAGGGVQGLSAGVATITYTLNGCWATQDITVNPNPSVGISGPSALCTTGLGQTYTLTDGTYTGGTWSSSNTSIVTVGSAGLATGVAVGSAIISYSMRYGGCIDVLPLNITSTVPAAITPTVNPMPLCVGANSTLSDATAGGTWTSSNSSVAMVNSLGNVYAVTAGTTNITYTLGGCYPAPVTVTVSALPSFTGTGQLCAGNSATMNPTPAGGTWSTRTTSLATIGSSSGIVTATPTGNGDTVSIFYTYNGCRAFGIDTIGAAVTTFTMSPTLCSGNNVTVTPVPSSKWVNSWTSSNPSVAFAGGSSTFASGAVTGVAGSGGGVVTISFTPPGCSTVYTTTVNVIDAGTINGAPSVCSTGAAAVTVLTEDATGGTWSVTNANGSLSGTTFTGATPGIDTVVYTVTSGSATCTATFPITIMACGPRGNQAGTTAGAEQKYTLFPNPGNGMITIRQSEAIDGAMSLTVINYIGATVYSGTLNFSGGESQVNLSNMATGMYLVMLTDSKGKGQTFKVVIEN